MSIAQIKNADKKKKTLAKSLFNLNVVDWWKWNVVKSQLIAKISCFGVEALHRISNLRKWQLCMSIKTVNIVDPVSRSCWLIQIRLAQLMFVEFCSFQSGGHSLIIEFVCCDRKRHVFHCTVHNSWWVTLLVCCGSCPSENKLISKMSASEVTVRHSQLLSHIAECSPHLLWNMELGWFSCPLWHLIWSQSNCCMCCIQISYFLFR